MMPDRTAILLNDVVQILILARTLIGISQSALSACSAAIFDSLLSIVTVSGSPFRVIAFSKYAEPQPRHDGLAAASRSYCRPGPQPGRDTWSPFTLDLHVGLVNAPAHADCTLEATECFSSAHREPVQAPRQNSTPTSSSVDQLERLAITATFCPTMRSMAVYKRSHNAFGWQQSKQIKQSPVRRA